MSLIVVRDGIMMRTHFLPFSRPDTDEAEINEVTEAIRSGWVTTGPKTHQFEGEFAAYVRARHAVAVNSCTAAMHLALEAVGLESIYAIAAEHNLAVIEDAAHAFPAKHKEQLIGQGPNGGLTSHVPHLACFSFYATKSITTGEGGMICTK